jgi:hypothetical protein
MCAVLGKTALFRQIHCAVNIAFGIYRQLPAPSKNVLTANVTVN